MQSVIPSGHERTHAPISQIWPEAQGLPHVAGVGVYRRTIAWDGRSRLLLHLPRCTDAVEVRVNGVSCGVRVWPPYVFELTAGLCRGGNELEIHLCNTLGNIITETYGGAAPSERPCSGLLEPPRLLTIGASGAASPGGAPCPE